MSDYLNSIRAKIAAIESGRAKYGSLTPGQETALANLRRSESEALVPKATTGRARVPYDGLLLSKAIDDPGMSDKQKVWAARLLAGGGQLSASDSDFVSSLVKKYG